MSLPLRLAAEPFVRKTFGQSCFVLPSLNEDKVCFIIADEGLLALAVDQHYQQEELSHFTALLAADMPVCFLVRRHGSEQQAHNSSFDWVLPEAMTQQGKGLRQGLLSSSQEVLACVKPLTMGCATAIVQSIERCVMLTDYVTAAVHDNVTI
jgi:hypothetical protein